MKDKKLSALAVSALKSQLMFNIVLAFLINFTMEIFGRKTFQASFQYMTQQTNVFLYNMALILLSLCMVFLIKRRVFGIVVVTTFWMAIGITNGIMLSYRITPFTVVDFSLIGSAFTVMGKYLSFSQQMLLYAAVFVVFAIFISVFLFGPRYKGTFNLKRNLMLFLLCTVGFFFLTKSALASGMVSRYFGNIANAYKEYGTPYCFTVTFVDRGIRKPTDYNQYSVKAAETKKLAGAKSPIAIKKGTEKKTPNIIFVQLESFFDPTLVKGLTFSEDPVPNFRQLKKEFSSGYLEVPVVGAGTCNTEFEVITGMNMDFFGPGEYPYKSIMKETTVETIAYDLKELGYTAQAMHDNSGNFYGRNKVYSRFGFDTFTSVEYMKYISTNPIGWVKDKILTREIMKSLESTPNQDLMYAVSVQAHGNYPSTPVYDEPLVKVSGLKNESDVNAFTYYVNQVHEMDEFIGQLVAKLSAYDEDTILVLYGDHLPSLNISKEQLKSKSIYRTQYVIWSNFDLPVKDRTLQAYQLSAAVLGRVGINNGTLVNYHQKNMGARGYRKNLKLLQYDMLYGKRYLYGQTNPFIRTDIQMGIDPILITGVEQDGKNTFVHGENFTKESGIALNGELKDTVYLDEFTLELRDYEVKEGDKFEVKQLGDRKTALSSTDPFLYEKPAAETTAQQ